MLKSKSNLTLIIVIILLITTNQSSGSLIDDFITSAKAFWPRSKDYSLDTGLKQLPTVDFELPSENDEFLKQGLELIKTPKGALDVCSHKVIMNLKKNCNQLALEEIGKLAIMLMNCHLQVENRPRLPCKPEMSLQQCTMGMDQNSYQIYTLMTHRAIGICSALKHDQFRALTEMTVNRLMQVTQSQSTAIHEALQNQRRINEMGIENIREHQDYNEKIKDSQHKTMEELVKAHDIIEEINSNIQREFELQKKSEEQMQAIDKTTSEISHHLEQTNRQMMAHYQEALDFLDNFKSMMDLIATFSNNIQNTFEKFQSIMREIGINITAEFFVFLTMNFIYFIFGMIFIIFMDLSIAYKHILIGLSAFNTLSAYYKADVSIVGTNALVWISYISFYRVLPVITAKIFSLNLKLPSLNIFNIKNLWKLKKYDSDDNQEEEEHEEVMKNNHRARSSTPIPSPKKKTKENSELAEIFENQKKSTTNANPPSTPARAETPNTIMQRPMTPAMARVMNSESFSNDRSGTPFSHQIGRIQCQSLTAKGLQCKNAALVGFTKCRVHNY